MVKIKKHTVLLILFILNALIFSCKKNTSAPSKPATTDSTIITKSTSPVVQTDTPRISRSTTVRSSHLDSVTGYYAGTSIHDSSNVITVIKYGEFIDSPNTYPQISYDDTIRISNYGHDSLSITSKRYFAYVDSNLKATINYTIVSLVQDPIDKKKISILYNYNNPNKPALFFPTSKSKYTSTVVFYKK